MPAGVHGWDAVTPGLPEEQRAWGGNGRDTPGVPGTQREPPGPCQRRVRAARWRRAALGRARGTPGLPCTSRALARGAGVPRGRSGSSPYPGRAAPLQPPPPPPVGGFTGFRGNECGAELGASVTEVPGKEGTGRGRCRVLRCCCRRPAPGEWPRGAAPAAPGSRAGPELPLSACCERWHGALGARRERGSPLARGGRCHRERDRGCADRAAPPDRWHRHRHRDRPAAGPARPEPPLGRTRDRSQGGLGGSASCSPPKRPR